MLIKRPFPKPYTIVQYSFRLTFCKRMMLSLMPIYKVIVGCTKPQSRILYDRVQVTTEIWVSGTWVPNHLKYKYFLFLFFIAIHP